MTNYNIRKKFYERFKKFCRKKDEKLSDDEQFVSFGIKDMYLSLLKYDVLSEIKNRINDNKFVTSIDKCALIELALLSLEFMSFTIDQKYYNQKQGLFIGAPTSPYFTEIYIQRVEKKSYLYNVKRSLSMVQKSWQYIYSNIT